MTTFNHAILRPQQYIITVCMVLQNCCKGRSKKCRKWHFSGCCRREIRI